MDKEKCHKCNGSGLAKHEPITCSYCDGKICYACENKAGFIRHFIDTCDECEGDGNITRRSLSPLKKSKENKY